MTTAILFSKNKKMPFLLLFLQLLLLRVLGVHGYLMNSLLHSSHSYFYDSDGGSILSSQGTNTRSSWNQAIRRTKHSFLLSSSSISRMENEKIDSKSHNSNSSSSPSSNSMLYPHVFTGRLWFSPAIVRIPSSTRAHPNISFLSLWGYTLGGTVVLEYDTSPVGPYYEYVTMSSLVYYSPNSSSCSSLSNVLSMGIGQWGSRLYVSNAQAEVICKTIWGVPAETANIQLIPEGHSLCIQSRPDRNEFNTSTIQNILVSGWKHTRKNQQQNQLQQNDPSHKQEERRKWGPLYIQWTPTIKALWLSPFSSTKSSTTTTTISSSDTSTNTNINPLPIHDLRLSASSIHLHIDFFSKNTQESVWIPLGVNLVVDNVMIEISLRKRV